MFPRIFRTTIQSNIVRGVQYGGTILREPTVKKLQDLQQPNFINHVPSQHRWISSFTYASMPLLTQNSSSYTSLFSLPVVNSFLNSDNLKTGIVVPTRSVTKFTRSRGKRQTVRSVLQRFYRLNWGIWIRTKAGRHNRLWRKRSSRKRRSRQHVFCNSTQSWLLDKMVSPYWRKPKYWVDDPYTPYHSREHYWVTRTKPRA